MFESIQEDKEEMNIHVKGWVIMNSKCVNVNEYGENIIRG